MNILVLCHGNQCRSPACAAVLVDALPNHEIVQGGFKVSSGRAAKKVRDWMAKQGYDLESHKPRVATEDDFIDAQVIIYMDGGNRKRIPEKWLFKSHCLGKYHPKKINRIRDPAFIAKGDSKFDYVMQELLDASNGLVKEIQKR